MDILLRSEGISKNRKLITKYIRGSRDNSRQLPDPEEYKNAGKGKKN